VAGFFAREIAPIEVPGKKGVTTLVSIDEHPCPETTLEQLSMLKTAYYRFAMSLRAWRIFWRREAC